MLLVSLGPERAGEVFKHLKDEEIERSRCEMAKTRQVPQDLSEAVWIELVETVMAEAYVAEGGVEYAREVLERSVGPTAPASSSGACRRPSSAARSSSCAGPRPSRSSPSCATRRRRRSRS